MTDRDPSADAGKLPLGHPFDSTGNPEDDWCCHEIGAGEDAEDCGKPASAHSPAPPSPEALIAHDFVEDPFPSVDSCNAWIERVAGEGDNSLFVQGEKFKRRCGQPRARHRQADEGARAANAMLDNPDTHTVAPAAVEPERCGHEDDGGTYACLLWKGHECAHMYTRAATPPAPASRGGEDGALNGRGLKACPFCGSANTRVSLWIDIGKSCAVCLDCEATGTWRTAVSRRRNLRPQQPDSTARALAERQDRDHTDYCFDRMCSVIQGTNTPPLCCCGADSRALADVLVVLRALHVIKVESLRGPYDDPIVMYLSARDTRDAKALAAFSRIEGRIKGGGE